jgi:hypothetical protein
MFSVFDMTSMGDDADLSEEPAPILNVETVIVDDTNFTNETHKRTLKIRAHVPYRKVTKRS